MDDDDRSNTMIRRRRTLTHAKKYFEVRFCLSNFFLLLNYFHYRSQYPFSLLQMQFFRCLLLSTWLFASAYRGNYKPFQNWQCVGCVADDTNATASIYRKVHRALRQRGSAREVYLLLDHSWIDRLLESSTVVVIHVIPRDELSDTHMVQQVDIQEEKKVDGMQREERYVVVYSPPAAHRRMVLRKVEALMIDTFLLKNPCFLPLHDPPVTLNDSQLLYPLGPPSRRLSTDGSMIRSMRETRVYELTAIFVRLPSYPYHATCKLYSLVTSRQVTTTIPWHLSHINTYTNLSFRGHTTRHDTTSLW